MYYRHYRYNYTSFFNLFHSGFQNCEDFSLGTNFSTVTTPLYNYAYLISLENSFWLRRRSLSLHSRSQRRSRSRVMSRMEPTTEPTITPARLGAEGTTACYIIFTTIPPKVFTETLHIIRGNRSINSQDLRVMNF